MRAGHGCPVHPSNGLPLTVNSYLVQLEVVRKSVSIRKKDTSSLPSNNGLGLLSFERGRRRRPTGR